MGQEEDAELTDWHKLARRRLARAAAFLADSRTAVQLLIVAVVSLPYDRFIQGLSGGEVPDCDGSTQFRSLLQAMLCDEGPGVTLGLLQEASRLLRAGSPLHLLLRGLSYGVDCQLPSAPRGSQHEAEFWRTWAYEALICVVTSAAASYLKLHLRFSGYPLKLLRCGLPDWAVRQDAKLAEARAFCKANTCCLDEHFSCRLRHLAQTPAQLCEGHIAELLRAIAQEHYVSNSECERLHAQNRHWSGGGPRSLNKVGLSRLAMDSFLQAWLKRHLAANGLPLNFRRQRQELYALPHTSGGKSSRRKGVGLNPRLFFVNSALKGMRGEDACRARRAELHQEWATMSNAERRMWHAKWQRSRSQAGGPQAPPGSEPSYSRFWGCGQRAWPIAPRELADWAAHWAATSGRREKEGATEQGQQDQRQRGQRPEGVGLAATGRRFLSVHSASFVVPEPETGPSRANFHRQCSEVCPGVCQTEMGEPVGSVVRTMSLRMNAHFLQPNRRLGQVWELLLENKQDGSEQHVAAILVAFCQRKPARAVLCKLDAADAHAGRRFTLKWHNDGTLCGALHFVTDHELLLPIARNLVATPGNGSVIMRCCPASVEPESLENLQGQVWPDVCMQVLLWGPTDPLERKARQRAHTDRFDSSLLRLGHRRRSRAPGRGGRAPAESPHSFGSGSEADPFVQAEEAEVARALLEDEAADAAADSTAQESRSSCSSGQAAQASKGASSSGHASGAAGAQVAQQVSQKRGPPDTPWRYSIFGGNGEYIGNVQCLDMQTFGTYKAVCGRHQRCSRMVSAPKRAKKHRVDADEAGLGGSGRSKQASCKQQRSLQGSAAAQP